MSEAKHTAHLHCKMMFNSTLLRGAPGGGVCMFMFEELCGRPVAAADYIALAGRFHTVAVEGVPEFSGATRSQARLQTVTH